MAEVIVNVNGRAFPISCNQGEENHITELAEYLNIRVQQFRSTGTVHGDSKLFLLAGLTAADELFEAVGRLENLEKEVKSLKSFYDINNTEKQQSEIQVVNLLNKVTARVEAITNAIEKNI